MSKPWGKVSNQSHVEKKMLTLIIDAFASSFTAFTATKGAFLSWILRARNKEQNEPLPTLCFISQVSLSIVLGLIMMVKVTIECVSAPIQILAQPATCIDSRSNSDKD